MSKKKTAEEIQVMREGGKLLSKALEAAAKAVRPSVTLQELDKIYQIALSKKCFKIRFTMA